MRGCWVGLCGCAYQGGCAQRCGLARAVPASLLSQHQNICPWHRAPALGVSPALCSSWEKKKYTRQQQAAVGKEQTCHTPGKKKGRLLFFHGTSNAAAFLVVLGIFLRWQFSDILGFHKFLIFSVSPWLQGKKNLPTSLSSSFTTSHYFFIATHQVNSRFKKYGGRKARVCCTFISL